MTSSSPSSSAFSDATVSSSRIVGVASMLDRVDLKVVGNEVDLSDVIGRGRCGQLEGRHRKFVVGKRRDRDEFGCGSGCLRRRWRSGDLGGGADAAPARREPETQRQAPPHCADALPGRARPSR